MLGIDKKSLLPIIKPMKQTQTPKQQTTEKKFGDTLISDIPFDRWLEIWQMARLEKVISLKAEHKTNEEIGKIIGVSRQIVGKILKMKKARSLAT